MSSRRIRKVWGGPGGTENKKSIAAGQVKTLKLVHTRKRTPDERLRGGINHIRRLPDGWANGWLDRRLPAANVCCSYHAEPASARRLNPEVLRILF